MLNIMVIDHESQRSVALCVRCDGTFDYYLLLIYCSVFFDRIFTAHRSARIASAVLAASIPSVHLSVRPSVTRRYCVKTTARSTVQFAPQIAKCV